MIETTAACIRGCSLYRQHLTDCAGESCEGCLPRRADYGRLCHTCHRRFELMLTDFPIVYRWLTGNMSGGNPAALDADRVSGGGDEAPAPIKAAIFDIRELLADRLALTSDHVAELLGITPPSRHSVSADAKFMLTWLTSIERLEFIGDWWEEFAETMIDAHALAPWRPAVRRIPRTPCPRCAETNLVIYGGETDVTCQSCKGMMTENEFWIWENVLQAQEEAS